MTTPPARGPRRRAPETPYVLDAQVGFILRQVVQRHTIIFAAKMGDDLTSTQWAALSKLAEKGACSQNLLGRLTAMDAATIKGVVDRLVKRGLVETRPDPDDGRRLVVDLTPQGHDLTARVTPAALEITDDTLAPLNAEERTQLLGLLERLR